MTPGHAQALAAPPDVRGIGWRLALALLLSVGLHLALFRAMDTMPQRPRPLPPPTLAKVRTVHEAVRPPDPPPPPPPPPKVEPPPPEQIHEAPAPPPKPRPQTKPRPSPTPAKPPPPTQSPATAEPTMDEPVFGLALDSMSQGGPGVAVPTGNTLIADPNAPRAPIHKVRPLPPPPVPAPEVTKMPEMKGRCAGAYTEDARMAGIEGTVVLDLVVDADGSTRDIVLLERLGHGLDEAAIDALKACRFQPGERGGVAVPTRVRGFKIRFFLADGE
ncbi:MAG: energy transducer TonB [Myxococcales bacterium]|nr:energy transducer TonB [Myxococcales bacterium]